MYHFGYGGTEAFEQRLFDVKPGEIIFIDSCKVDNIEKSMLGTDIRPVEQPDRKTVLKGLLPHLKGTGWDKRAEDYLKGLK